LIVQALSNGSKSCADPLRTCLSCATPGMSFAGSACSLPEYVYDVRFAVSQYRLFSNRILYELQHPVYGQDPCGNALPPVSQRTCRDPFSRFCATIMSPILHVHQWSLGDSAFEHVHACVSGMKFQLTFGVHEQLSARVLSLNASVAQRHGSDHLCYVAIQMLEGALQFTAPVEGGVDVTGDSAPGRMSRDHCLHCACRSRCQSGTDARGASVRHSVSDVVERRSDTVNAHPMLWMLGSGSVFHEHQTCIGLYLTACLVQFPGTTPQVALDIDLKTAIAWSFLGPLGPFISVVP
jgi:hypothetical protein